MSEEPLSNMNTFQLLSLPRFLFISSSVVCGWGRWPTPPLGDDPPRSLLPGHTALLLTLISTSHLIKSSISHLLFSSLKEQLLSCVLQNIHQYYPWIFDALLSLCDQSSQHHALWRHLNHLHYLRTTANIVLPSTVHTTLLSVTHW